ncbi:hypothetical protein BU251_02380 [Candidatus Velamenicoccus archaeovorus]|uniref:Membrane-anchored protein n=1 Tax=Velamenicoccus archaeovorus TaxID=1930593 RepID=A0A410P382_VELA1|nr:hypothetical protein [Candidatus Velamenicoccus archaeovorus]QAT16655.1 hypothetical protein BU251_02380 [Candidatus Velamenicoccus archaeovorus]
MSNESAAVIKNRVPHIIFLYWVIKIVSTTLGETGADMFSMTFKLGYWETILIFMGLFVIFLTVKLALKGYHPWMYWLTFTASAIAGTAISDFIDRTLKLGYAKGALILVVLLLIILAAWYKKEKSINVEYITTFRAESFYWVAFLFANTLGTAAGDFLADNMGLGFMHSAVLLSAMLVVIALLHLYTKVSSVMLFWLAFVLTRPFGAAFGDLLTKPHASGGLNLGTIGSSIVILTILFLAISKESMLEKGRLARHKHGQWT